MEEAGIDGFVENGTLLQPWNSEALQLIKDSQVGGVLCEYDV